jgi:glutamate-1-semialdehyde 2,1-aminomutase
MTPKTDCLPFTAYTGAAARSRELYERARKVMPGGNTRHSIALHPYPVYAASGAGCRVTDVEGEERIDFLNNFTSLILGHAHPEVTRAVQERVALGTAFTMPTETDVALAELLCERVPYVEQIRFCNSGSEAVMLAIKAARAFTGRHKIAKFEGAYHGIYDYAEVSEGPTEGNWGDPADPERILEPGSPPSQADDVVLLRWNHFEQCRAQIERHRQQLAAVIVDPVCAGIGLIPPLPGFFEMLREETDKAGILLISDEVLSFRVAYDGALTAFGVAPDLVSLGKIIGGGFPTGAVAGSRRVMSVFDHTGECRVHHGGTFNANPVTTTAGLETMRRMTREAYQRLNTLGDLIRERLTRMLADAGSGGQVCGRGSLFLAHLNTEPLVDYRSLRGYSRTQPAYLDLCHEMLRRGVMTSPRGLFGCLSTPMEEAEIDAFVEAARESLIAVRGH